MTLFQRHSMLSPDSTDSLPDSHELIDLQKVLRAFPGAIWMWMYAIVTSICLLIPMLCLSLRYYDRTSIFYKSISIASSFILIALYYCIIIKIKKVLYAKEFSLRSAGDCPININTLLYQCGFAKYKINGNLPFFVKHLGMLLIIMLPLLLIMLFFWENDMYLGLVIAISYSVYLNEYCLFDVYSKIRKYVSKNKANVSLLDRRMENE